jgi:hypothetical protein
MTNKIRRQVEREGMQQCSEEDGRNESGKFSHWGTRELSLKRFDKSFKNMA